MDLEDFEKGKKIQLAIETVKRNLQLLESSNKINVSISGTKLIMPDDMANEVKASLKEKYNSRLGQLNVDFKNL